MISEQQKLVKAFVERHDLAINPQARLLDLVSEVGELAKEALKATEYGREEFAPGENWAPEIGDALFSLICVANSSGVDLAMALNEALERYEMRLAETGSAGSEIE